MHVEINTLPPSSARIGALLILLAATTHVGFPSLSHAWTDPNYADTVLLYEFANTNSPTDDDSYIGTNAGYLGEGAYMPTWAPATNTMSANYLFNQDYVRVPDSPSLVFNTSAGDTPFTVSAWIQKRWGTFPIMVKADPGTNAPFEWAFGTYGNSGYRFVLYDDGRGGESAIKSYRDSEFDHWTWTHIVGTYSGNGSWLGLTLYRNGRQMQSGHFAPFADGPYYAMSNTTSAVFVGACLRPGALISPYAGENYADGSIDRPTIHMRELTQRNVDDIFWHTATNYGWHAYDFNNRSDWSNTVYVGNFEYDAPADTSYAGTNRGVKGPGGAAPTLIDDGLNAWYFFEAGDTITITIPAEKHAYTWWGRTNLTWHHYAEIDGAQYVDAVSASFTNKFFFTNGDVVTLGKNTATYLSGDIDEFRVYTALSPASLTNLYNGTKSLKKERGMLFEL